MMSSGRGGQGTVNDDASKKQLQLDRVVRNLGTRGGRAALIKRCEHSLRSSDVPCLVRVSVCIAIAATLLFFVSILGSISSIHDNTGYDLLSRNKQAQVLERILKKREPDEQLQQPPDQKIQNPQLPVEDPVAIVEVPPPPKPAKQDVPADGVVEPPAKPAVNEPVPEAVAEPAVEIAEEKIKGPDEGGGVSGLYLGKLAVFPGVDANHLHGKIGILPDGSPSWQPKPLTFRMTQEQKAEAHKGYCFNTRVSDSLPLDRPVPDYNGKACLLKTYDLSTLPKASVIIVFHNENLSALIRSVHSVLNRTPPEILDQVILVDDDSNKETHPWLGEELDLHIKYLPKTRLRRLETRHGLMLARMAGVEWSKSDVTVFLDSHIECAKRWLEPLVQSVKENPRTLPIPLIHTIDADSFDFEKGYLSVLGFSWSLGQTHPHRPLSEDGKPMPSPIMAGGLFAVGREWFLEAGGYDPEMKLYGGEEMEIGFKMWMCGGRLEAHPCSRVGHVFRTSAFWKGQVYKVPGEEIHRNKLRVAEVWMDEYKEIAKMAIPPLPQSMDLGPLDAVKQVRERLKCKSFKWYLDNVYPELDVPDMSNSRAGAVQNDKLHACLDTLGNKHGDIGAYPCHNSHGTQAFLLDQNNDLRVTQLDYQKCVTVNGNKVVLDSCKRQAAHYDPEEETMKIAGKCLEVSTKSSEKSPFSLMASECDPSNMMQRFRWVL